MVLETYLNLLKVVTGDGSKKRQAGAKPPWWKDGSHEAAIFSHLSKWKHGELRDKDSGAHPLVHLAWRALAIAYQETCGKVDPGEKDAPILGSQERIASGPAQQEVSPNRAPCKLRLMVGDSIMVDGKLQFEGLDPDSTKDYYTVVERRI